ncbi:MAG: hypothetical protein AAGD47_01825 [Pseudomonadota bacterium]
MRHKPRTVRLRATIAATCLGCASLAPGAMAQGTVEQVLERATSACVESLETDHGVVEVSGMEAWMNNLRPFVSGNAVFNTGNTGFFRCTVSHGQVSAVRFWDQDPSGNLPRIDPVDFGAGPDAAETPVDPGTGGLPKYDPAQPKFVPAK